MIRCLVRAENSPRVTGRQMGNDMIWKHLQWPRGRRRVRLKKGECYTEARDRQGVTTEDVSPEIS